MRPGGSENADMRGSEVALGGVAAGGIGGAVTCGAVKYGKSQKGYNHAFGACMQARGYTVG